MSAFVCPVSKLVTLETQSLLHMFGALLHSQSVNVHGVWVFWGKFKPRIVLELESLLLRYSLESFTDGVCAAPLIIELGCVGVPSSDGGWFIIGVQDSIP